MSKQDNITPITALDALWSSSILVEYLQLDADVSDSYFKLIEAELIEYNNIKKCIQNLHYLVSEV